MRVTYKHYKAIYTTEGIDNLRLLYTVRDILVALLGAHNQACLGCWKILSCILMQM